METNYLSFPFPTLATTPLGQCCAASPSTNGPNRLTYVDDIVASFFRLLGNRLFSEL